MVLVPLDRQRFTIQKNALRCDVQLFWPGLVCPILAPTKKPLVTANIATTLPEVHSSIPPSSKQKHPQEKNLPPKP